MQGINQVESCKLKVVSAQMNENRYWKFEIGYSLINNQHLQETRIDSNVYRISNVEFRISKNNNQQLETCKNSKFLKRRKL